MKYYHLHIDQNWCCGCWEDLYLEATNEEEVEKFAKNNAYDILYDYFDDDEDGDDWSESIYWNIEEITKEEYEENK
jgi:hypothetical protein